MAVKSAEAPFNQSRSPALFFFAALCVAVISSYVLMKIEILSRPILQPLDTSQRPASPMEGKPAPEFKLKNLNGGTTRLSDHKGKVIMVNVWATWCAPCREEMPSMEKLYNMLKGNNFEMLAVSIDRDGEKSVRPFIEELGLTFPVLLDPKSKITKKYKTTGVPETFIINKEGTIVFHLLGPTSWDRPDIVNGLRSLMGLAPITDDTSPPA